MSLEDTLGYNGYNDKQWQTCKTQYGKLSESQKQCQKSTGAWITSQVSWRKQHKEKFRTWTGEHLTVSWQTLYLVTEESYMNKVAKPSHLRVWLPSGNNYDLKEDVHKKSTMWVCFQVHFLEVIIKVYFVNNLHIIYRNSIRCLKMSNCGDITQTTRWGFSCLSFSFFLSLPLIHIPLYFSPTYNHINTNIEVLLLFA